MEPEKKKVGAKPVIPHRKKIPTPEHMMHYFEQYVSEVKGRPFKVKDWVGKDAIPVTREKEKPLTMDGFCVWLYKNGIAYHLDNYIYNTEGNYGEYAPTMQMIRKMINCDVLEGAMAGMYAPGVSAKILGLIEKTETENVTRVINVEVVPSSSPIAGSEKEIKMD